MTRVLSPSPTPGHARPRLQLLRPAVGRVASDVVALVEKASEAIEVEEAERLAKRMAKGQFDMNDFLAQIRQLRKMGGLGGLMGMLPGIGKMQKQIAAAGIDDSMIKRQEAIILSMTKKERIAVGLLNASRRKRIAAGSGTTVQDVNRLVKQYQDMARMMKKMGGKTGAAAMKAMLGGSGMRAAAVQCLILARCLAGLAHQGRDHRGLEKDWAAGLPKDWEAALPMDYRDWVANLTVRKNRIYGRLTPMKGINSWL